MLNIILNLKLLLKKNTEGAKKSEIESRLNE